MQITLKLFAGLTDYLPSQGREGNAVVCELKEGATISQVIDSYNMPPKLIHLVLVNGHYVEPQKRIDQQLHEGDVLAVWPPVAGG